MVEEASTHASESGKPAQITTLHGLFTYVAEQNRTTIDQFGTQELGIDDLAAKIGSPKSRLLSEMEKLALLGFVNRQIQQSNGKVNLAAEALAPLEPGKLGKIIEHYRATHDAWLTPPKSEVQDRAPDDVEKTKPAVTNDFSSKAFLSQLKPIRVIAREAVPAPIAAKPTTTTVSQRKVTAPIRWHSKRDTGASLHEKEQANIARIAFNARLCEATTFEKMLHILAGPYPTVGIQHIAVPTDILLDKYAERYGTQDIDQGRKFVLGNPNFPEQFVDVLESCVSNVMLDALAPASRDHIKSLATGKTYYHLHSGKDQYQITRFRPA